MDDRPRRPWSSQPFVASIPEPDSHDQRMNHPPPINRELFINEITARFPEVAATFDDIDKGLLHLEVAAFRRCVENAMDDGRLWDVERYGRFIADSFKNADDALGNAIGVSFIEDFALGETTEQRLKAVRERLPKTLQDEIISINDRWR
jgi:hypothetical protein